MIYLTILNTIAIVYLFYKKGKFYIDCRKDTTFIKNTVVAYHITLWKKTSEFSASGVYTLVIPIKNKKKVEKEEEINRMIATYSQQNKLQTLSAKFSWLKTWKEVRQFEKDYSVVDRKIVERLVTNFVPKQ
jgi:hypothetical protein